MHRQNAPCSSGREEKLQLLLLEAKASTASLIADRQEHLPCGEEVDAERNTEALQVTPGGICPIRRLHLH